MKLKEAFNEIFTGYNMTNAVGSNEKAEEVYFINKDSIQFTNIILNKLVSKTITTSIKNKYFMQERDIIISLKKPYKVGTYRFKSEKIEKIVIPNNYIVLRGIDRNYYSYIFVANYLEKIKFADYDKKDELRITDINEIELPDISKEEQMKITPLINRINERSTIYDKILKNDDEIIKYALKEVIGENNDK